MDPRAQGDVALPYAADVLSAAPSDPLAPPLARSRLGRWLTLTRPATLLVGVGPVVATLALLWARGVRLAPLAAVCAVLAAGLALAGANMLDEYLDYERFVARRGPVLRGQQLISSALEDAGLAPLDALRLSLVLLALGAVAGLPLVAAGGPLVLLLGLLGFVAAFLYSATSYALKRLPAGELAVALALGPGLVAVTLLTQHQRMQGADVVLGVALGCFALALLEVSHLRDAPADRQQRRRTLVLLLGERGGRVLCAACFIAAFALMTLVAFQPGVYRGAIAVLLAAPAAVVPLTGALRAESARARRFVVGQTLRAYLAFALWLTAGFLVAGAVVRLYPAIRAFLGF
jgi:1,4-dihydroxy-2-naphthoate octaprenyltransferase